LIHQLEDLRRSRKAPTWTSPKTVDTQEARIELSGGVP
jgi:hypothetical protein